MKSCEVVAKSADEAIELALAQLNTTIDEVEIEIFEESAKGMLGFLKPKEVRVVVTLKEKNVSIEEIAENFLSTVLKTMHMNAKLSIELKSDALHIDLAGDDMAVLIGRRGQTLDSLQYLVSLVINKHREDYLRVVLDTENYRQKREESLIKLANKLAFKAKKYRKDVVLEPMNPYERRIIHSALQDVKNVSTRSEGEEPNRKVVIFFNK